MRWERGHRSGHVIDRRGQAPVRAGNLGMLLPLAGRFGWKGILLLLVLVILVGRGMFGLGGSTSKEPRTADEASAFVGFVLDDVQASWERRFVEMNRPYRQADLVLFSDATETRCGFGTSAVGPFYCPNDRRVYIDLVFFADLDRRLGAPGDFAQAYVIAHEVGHHVQHQLGALGGGSSVNVELQADCYAGLWARSANDRTLLEPGDIEEALAATAAVGDDTLQRRGQGQVQPETFTHGSAEQRTRWFRRGYDSGDVKACDTFGADTQ
jgi:predicted metalloprotease